MVIAEFLCKVHGILCYAARLPFELPDIVNSTKETLAKVTDNDISTIKKELAFNTKYSGKISYAFTSTLVNELQAIKKYTKGDTLSKLCNPSVNTIGETYIKMKGKFLNPVLIKDKPLEYNAFELIDAIESVIELVMNYELANINTTELKNRINRLKEVIRTLIAYTEWLLTHLKSNDNLALAAIVADLSLDLLIFKLEMLLNSCFVEQIEALKSEYRRRMAQYRLARNLSYYFKTHGGIEHKAGVPRGGTFILVYHEERKNRYIDKNALFVNNELGNLMVSRFRDLITSEVPVDTLINQTRLLETSILYKDPELYVRFRDVLTQYLDDCTDLPDDKRKELTEIVNRTPQQEHFKLTDGMVIADFYIPYLCCSDCPPIAYILPEKPEEPVEKPTIDIKDKSYCSDDGNSYPITVTPKDGEISGPGISIQNDNSYAFMPAIAGPGLQQDGLHKQHMNGL
jgi:hypothetical protein